MNGRPDAMTERRQMGMIVNEDTIQGTTKLDIIGIFLTYVYLIEPFSVGYMTSMISSFLIFLPSAVS